MQTRTKEAPDLDVDNAPSNSYNCYGNGVGKEVDADPFGYLIGNSTRTTYEGVKLVLGNDNVRELTSINESIDNDEFKVAMKCGPSDYHFIRLTDNGWYNKSGNVYQGLYIPDYIVANDVWCAMAIINGEFYQGEPYYTDETIYFAVRKDWYK